MEDDSIQIETEIQQLNHDIHMNRNRNEIQNQRIQHIQNSSHFFKYFSLIIIILILLSVTAVNKIYNIDYKKFNYTKNNLLQIYYNSLLKSLRTTFINEKINTNDEFIHSQHLENLENLNLKNNFIHLENFTLLKNLISGENLKDDSENKQEIRILLDTKIKDVEPSEEIFKITRKNKEKRNFRLPSIVNYI